MKKIVLAILVCSQSLGVISQDQMDLMEMSLDELMNMTITTASKQAETLSESPAIVSVITAEELSALGVESLSEALTYLPGVNLSESYFGYATLNFRGIRQVHYNNKVLFMINGHPSFERINGSFHLEQISIELIERIEVIRGPGSALYGTNAFTGVINVITRKAPQNGGRVVASGGSFGHGKVDGYWGRQHQWGSWIVGGSWQNQSGYDYDGVFDEPSGGGRVPVDLDYYNDVSNLFVAFEKGAFTFNAGWFQQNKPKIGLTPEVNWGGENEFSGIFADLKYEKKLGKGTFLGRLRYDDSDRSFAIGHFPADAALGRDTDTIAYTGGDLLGAELQYTMAFNEKLTLISGFVYESSDADPYTFEFTSDGAISPFSAFLEEYENRDTSAYAQLTFKPGSGYSLIAGARFNDNSDAVDSKVVPRAGAVFRLAGEAYLKVLYGEAYRNPDFFEKYVATNGVLWGDPNLERELISTLDIGLDIRFAERNTFRLNGYALETDNLITRRPAINNPNGAEYFNAGGEDIHGLEVEWRRYSQKGSVTFVNVTLLDGEDNLSHETLTGIPDISANAGTQWHFGKGFRAGLNVQYVGEKEYRSVLDGNGETGAYTLANLGVFYDNGPWAMSLQARNLADEDYRYTEYIRANIKEVPGGPGRSFFLRAGYRMGGK